jgi:hypothetical protein
MPDALQTVSDERKIGGTSSHYILFRVVAPGPITIHSDPADHPNHSESGLLGWLILRRPGNNTPVKQEAQLTDQFMALTYQATAADVAVGGTWTCQVYNGADYGFIWHTNIRGFITDIPFQTASFDIGLLNLLLAEAVTTAEVQLHLESSGDDTPRSTVLWSAAIAPLMNGSRGRSFHLDDQPYETDIGDVVFRIKNLDAEPTDPLFLLLTNPLRLELRLRFRTDNALLEALDWEVPDITISSFEAGLSVDFDGTIYPFCSTTATLRFNSIDVSHDVADAVVKALRDRMFGDPELAQFFSSDQVQSYINSFFTRLLRLGQQAQIRGYRADGPHLIVDHYPTPP